MLNVNSLIFKSKFLKRVTAHNPWLGIGSSDIILNATILKIYFEFLNVKYGIKTDLSYLSMAELLIKGSYNSFHLFSLKMHFSSISLQLHHLQFFFNQRD